MTTNNFEENCVYNLNHQYEQWKSNDWGKSPICIPDALEVNEKWFIRTLDPNAADYGKMAVERNAIKLEGNKAEQAVHKAFQRSTIGGMLIHGVDFASFRKKLLGSKAGIPKEILDNLKKLSDKKSFEIDFLFFHPICGIIVMECKAINIKNTGGKAHSYAMNQLDRNVKKLFELFKILTGCDCPTELVHYLLCIPNSKKDSLKESDKEHILDKNNLEDNVAFEDFWRKRNAHMEHQASCFKNENICRFIAIIFGFRSALFTSLCRNALEIHRMVDSHESNRHSKRSLTFTTYVTDQHHTSGKKTIFLNSEQISAYEKAKCVYSLLLFGPPGCGKTLLIMNLVKESAELEKPGRVVVILPYPALIEMYGKFFAANKSNQRRVIVINPSAEELQISMADDSVDDVFADEVLYGMWINSKTNRKNGQIIIGVTIGRFYHKAHVTIARDNLVNRLRDADFSTFELKTVMRNTGNIFGYYKRFNPDNQITIGHNIQGRNVNEYLTKNIDSACSLIVDHIKQYLKTSDCTSNDIAVLIAHEPLLSQIEKVKSSLQKVGIEVGSVVEQLQANNSTDESLVAVDCSANVLSCEWPIVFVIDARNCPSSTSVANPMVACSRAVSSLYVINTQECKYPYFRIFCKKFFVSMIFSKERKQVTALHYHDLLREINMNPFHKRLFQYFFMIPWIFLFFVIPALLFSEHYEMWSTSQFDSSGIITDYVFLGVLCLINCFTAVLSVVSFALCFLDDGQYYLRRILNVLNALSVTALIFMYFVKGDVMDFVLAFFSIANFYLFFYLASFKFYKLGGNFVMYSFIKSNSPFFLFVVFLQYQIVNFVIILIAPVYIVFFAIEGHKVSLENPDPTLLLFLTFLYNMTRWPLRSKHLKCVKIDPAARS